MENAETLQPDVTACICKVNVERDVMVQCRECDRFAHQDCYGLMDSDLEDDFMCAFCKGMISHDELPQDDLHQGNEANLEDVAGLLRATHKYHAAIGPMRLLLSNYHFKNKDEMIINFVKCCPYCNEIQNAKGCK
eukprot:NODE_251_length_11743_cov_0.676788.p5 type:complete len:135 gc:universal NODE_251_length_11743_cov_0.676788:5665-5261(-)